MKLHYSYAKYDFDDIDGLWKCNGYGVNGYGETVKEAYEDWVLCSTLTCPVKSFIWRMIHKDFRLTPSSRSIYTNDELEHYRNFN